MSGARSILRAWFAIAVSLPLLAAVCGCLALAISLPTLAQAPLYHVTRLGTLGGAANISYGINASGQVVGQAQDASGNYHAFLWLPAPAYGLPAGLNDLDFFPGGFFSQANGINAAGQVVGEATDLVGNTHAFLWLPKAAYGLSAGLNDLGTLGGKNSAAFGINATGQIAGQSQDAGGNTHTFLWLPSAAYGLPAGMNDLGTIDGGTTSQAGGINALGQVAGYGFDTHAHYHAFLWLPSAAYGLPTGMNDLGILSGGAFSSATAVNDSGQISGSASAANGDFHAFLWLPTAAYDLPAGMNDLGTLGGAIGGAAGLNASGQVVGDAQDTAGITRAFLWQNGRMVDLNTLSDSPGIHLMSAQAINDSGQIVEAGGYLLTPIDRIEPAQGGNTGLVSMTLVRPGLQSGATVKLVGSGSPDIPGSKPTVFYAPDFRTTILKTTFNLTGKTPGPRSVVVAQPDGTTLTMSNTFTVVSGGAPDVQVRLLGSNKIIGGDTATYTLEVTNRGTVDALDVPLWLANLPNQILAPELDFQLNNLSNTGSDSNFVSAANQDMLPLILSRLAAGETRTLQFDITPPRAGSTAYALPLSAWPDPAYQQVSLNGLSANLQACWQTVLQEVYLETTGTPASAADLTKGELALQGQFQLLMNQAYQNTATVDALTPLTQLVALAVKAIAQSQGKTLDNRLLNQAVNSVLGQLTGWQPTETLFGTPLKTTRVVQVGDAYDPNDIRGPLSLKSGTWISGTQAVQYTISFDNLASMASASAREVQVMQYLDPNLDPTTLSLGPINLPQQSLAPTAGISPMATLRSFSQQANLPNTDDAVDITAAVDLNTSQLAWNFQTIDLSTGQPPTSADQGFLYPGGEGSMTITITPRANLPTGTVISAYANITFDPGPSAITMSTSTWTNQIDNTPPVSQVQALPAQIGLGFLVRWSGVDVGSGVQDYTIYVSDNSAAFLPWLVHTTATRANFFGEIGHTYRFYSIARDNVDNVEAPPANLTDSSRVVSTTVIANVRPGVPSPLRPLPPPATHLPPQNR